MRENTLKQRLYAGKATFGVMCTFPSPPVVEMARQDRVDEIRIPGERAYRERARLTREGIVSIRVSFPSPRVNR